MDLTPTPADRIARRWARRLALVAAFVAVAVLGTWVTDSWALLSFGAGYVPMAPLTALFVLTLVALVFVRSREALPPTVDRVARLVSLVVGVLAIGVAFAESLGIGIAVEAWLARTEAMVGGITVGRVSRYTAMLIAAIAIAMAWPARRKTAAGTDVGVLLAVVIATVLVLQGYLLGGPPLYQDGTIPVAATTALALCVVSAAAILALGAARWPVRVFVPPDPSQSAITSPWAFRTLTVLLGFVIISSGYFWLRGEQLRSERRASERLEAIADLKADQLGVWFEGHLSTARTIRSLPLPLDAALRRPADDAGRSIGRWLRTLRERNGYASAAIYDAEGRALAVEGPVDASHATEVITRLRDQRDIVVDDIHIHDGEPTMSLWVPLAEASDDHVTAWVLLEIDPRTSVFPVLRDVPLPSPTLEMVLWRRDGDSAVVLDRLGTDDAVLVPVVDTSSIIGIRGVLGDTAVREAVDYRGVPVVAVARPVPGRPWVVVAKIDQAELAAPVTRSAIVVTTLSLLLLFGAITAVGALWSRRDLAVASRELRLVREREESVEELRASEARYARAMRGTSDGLWDWEIDTGSLYVSPRWREMLGLPPGESRTDVNEFFSRVHPDDRPTVSAALDAHQASGAPYDVEFRLRHADGSYIWVRDRGEVDRDGPRDRRRMSGAITDITSRRSTEESLRRADRILRVRSAGNLALVRTESEAELLQAVCDVAVREGGYRMAWIGFVEHDAEQTVRPKAWSGDVEGYLDQIHISWSADRPDGQGPTGRCIRTGTPQPAQDLLAEAHYAPWREAAAARGFASSCSIPLRVRHEVIGALMLYSSEPNAFDATEVALLTEVASDLSFGITAKRDHEALAQQQAQLSLFRQVMERSNDAVYLADAETGRFVDFNRTAAVHLGYERDELLQLGPVDVVVGMGTERSWSDTVAAVRARGDVVRRSVHRRKDGSEFPVEVAITAIETGGRLIMLSIARDITDRDRADAEREGLRHQLLQAQKMESVGRLAGGVAHDFNNLLTVINATADLVLTQIPADTPTHHDLLEIKAAGERAARLTRQLLAFSRQQVMHREVLDLNHVVTDFLKMMRRVIGEDIALEVSLADTPAPVNADPGQLEQVLMNLAVNARDAMPGGGRLTISTAHVTLDEAFVASHATTEVGPHVRLRVSDTGIGMGPDVQARIFEPFFTTKETGKGTGLGLAMVYGIVKQTGGSIWLESAVGRGTSFDIYLPLAELPSPTRTSDPVATASSGTETVLLVEDEDSIRLVARRVLERAGYVIHEAASGADALAFVAQHTGSIDLLLTDLVMPGITGVELADELTARYPSLKVLLTSGYSADAVAADDPRFKRWTLLSKPYSVRDLLHEVRRTLDAP